MVDWNLDAKKDLIVGDANGQVTLFLNIGENDAPVFGAGTLVEVGPAGEKVPLDVGIRATPLFLDWDEDGRRDLVCGAYDGRIHLLLNTGSDAAPDFEAVGHAAGPSGDLVVAELRSSPVVADLDGDGAKDLLSGNTAGQILYYRNLGSDAAAWFGEPEAVFAAGEPIDFPGTPRTRPFLCDWTGDALPDLLVGIVDGRVHLFEGVVTDVALAPSPARLGLPWPNPANPDLRADLVVERPGHYRVSVLDPLGRERRVLLDSRLAEGLVTLRWDGLDDAGEPAPSGLYLIRLRGEGLHSSRKVVLLR